MAGIRKNDNVKVLAGRDRGKTGKVLKIYPAGNSAIVEGINFVKRHARRTQQNPQGGIVQKEVPIDLSNIELVCNRCNRGTKVGFRILSDGSKARYCKECNETI